MGFCAWGADKPTVQGKRIRQIHLRARLERVARLPRLVLVTAAGSLPGPQAAEAQTEGD